MLYKLTKIFALLLSFSLLTCKSDKNNRAQTQIEQIKITEDFLVFYEKFHLDTTYQINHIIFPLAGQKNQSNEEALIESPFAWSKDNWVFHRPFDDMGGTFIRRFEEFSGIISEIIETENKQFSMLKRFSKIDDKWMLIYYKEMGL